jgi:acyl carrier protein
MNTLDQVTKIVAECLNISRAHVNENSSADNIDVWDSMAQVNLMISLEQMFDIELEVEDFIELTSVQLIANYLDQRI